MASDSKTRISDTRLEELAASWLDDFFKRRLQLLRTLSFGEALLSCNPYMLALEGSENAARIVEELVKAHLRASDESVFREATGDPDFYRKLIRLVKDEPPAHRAEYSTAWAAAINRFTLEFTQDFCFSDGRMDWEKLVRFVSEEKPTKGAQ